MSVMNYKIETFIQQHAIYEQKSKDSFKYLI